MPLPRTLALFNRVVTNRITRPLATLLPGLAVIAHRGRVSGKEYRTPVNAWLDDESAIVALTYGHDVDWLKNLRAAEGGAIVSQGKTYQVGAPVLIGSEGMSRMPSMVRFILGTIDVDEFAVMSLLRPDRPT
ncbi:MAG: nitroreductase family deazaflavin-dependent oxidoreductase [Acidimicrobiia bacterium]